VPAREVNPMSELATSWERAWGHLGLQPPVGLFDRLVQAYQEPQRHYHSLQHLQECMQHFSCVHDLAMRPGEVEIALWFHDAIYELQGKDNELQSAQWAVASLAMAGATSAVQERVHGLIMATRHDGNPSDPDQQLLVDIDLAILGADPRRFDEYDRQIRAEYRWVPGFLYTRKRKAVLDGFLVRDAIYNTGHFRDRCEAQARANLARAVNPAGSTGQ